MRSIPLYLRKTRFAGFQKILDSVDVVLTVCKFIGMIDPLMSKTAYVRLVIIAQATSINRTSSRSLVRVNDSVFKVKENVSSDLDSDQKTAVKYHIQFKYSESGNGYFIKHESVLPSGAERQFYARGGAGRHFRADGEQACCPFGKVFGYAVALSQ